MLCIREVYILGEQRRRERKKQESCCVCTAKKRHALCTRFCTAETWLKAWNIGIHSAHRKKEINMYHCMFLTSGFSFLLILHIKLRLCIIKIPVLLWSRREFGSKNSRLGQRTHKKPMDTGYSSLVASVTSQTHAWVKLICSSKLTTCVSNVVVCPCVSNWWTDRWNL